LDDVSFVPVPPRFDHARFTALDLAPVANLGLGGWMAVLPEMERNDLSSLVTGERVLADRSFHIASGDQALIVLGDPDHPALPRRAEIAVGSKVAGLSFLHTALFAKAKAGETVGNYRVTYADGTTASHPIVNQRTIADWFKPVADPAVPVAESIDMPDRIPRCLYTDRWANPHPDKEIRSLAVEATGGAVLIVVAISQENP
jgi:beta-galactosidase